MLKQILSATKVVLLALALSFGLSYALAWTAPTATPPGANVAAPINASATAQVKTGGLTVGSLTTAGAVTAGSVSTTGLTTTGTLRVTGGAPGLSKVLTSDASGNATWQPAAGSSFDATNITTGVGIGQSNTTAGSLKVGANAVTQVALGNGDLVGGSATGGFQFDGSGGAMYLEKDSANATGVHLFSRKSRGTASVPAAIITGDDTFLLRGYAHDGTSFVESSRITFDTEGTIGTGIVPGNLKFATANSSGVITNNLTINSAGLVTIPGTVTTSDVYTSTGGFYLSTAKPHGKQLFTSNGTFVVPAGVTTVWVTGVGGGGAGRYGQASGGSLGGEPGYGGLGGASVIAQAVSVTPGSSHVVTRGAGGVGGTTGTPTAGGTSSFGSLVTMAGGAAGSGFLPATGKANRYGGWIGGGSAFGAGGIRSSSSGTGYGAGGAGGEGCTSCTTGDSGAGGNGTAGFVLVEW